MMGWIFQGNPDRFRIEDYLSRYPELIYWHTPRYARKIELGDRAFIWRARRNAAAIAIGTVVEHPTPASFVRHPEALAPELWIGAQPPANDYKTGIRVDEHRLNGDDKVIQRTAIRVNAILGSISFMRMANGTVFELSDDQTREMERLWGITAFDTLVHGNEGELVLRAHYIRERCSRLRKDKLDSFRAVHSSLHCEICREKEGDKYPSNCGDSRFEVHHLAPLSTAAAAVRTTLNDLVVICANCHRLVHANRNVDDNYRKLRMHFGARPANQ
jgi:hypothetical protein